jgi:crotonobetainyl-CoA:carnitine CoA-transferase CaiB-like acyl-CoA transferase
MLVWRRGRAALRGADIEEGHPLSELLSGVRVVESAMLFNGDTVGAHLGDLGADVIKVEGPPVGDYLRHFLGQIVPGHSPAHVQINRNKRSVGLDLRTNAGREVFWRLLDTADVFVDGNAFDACDRLGIGYEAQKARKPDIVYCQHTGFGRSGPYAAIPTHGQMMNALAAATPMQRGNDGFLHPAKPTHAPMRGMESGGEGTAAGAIHAAFFVAAALVQRARTGEGAYIDVSGYEGVISQAWIAATYSVNEDRIADRSTMPASDQGEMTGALYQFYECADGHNLLFCCIEPKFWRNFCSAIARPDLLDANRASGGAEVDFGVGQDDLRRELQAIFETRPLSDWVALAASHDIAMGPAYRSLVEAADDPQFAARESFYTDVHPEAGEYTFVREAGIVAGQPYRIRHHAPRYGQNTSEVLEELGYSGHDIEQLLLTGAATGGRQR